MGSKNIFKHISFQKAFNQAKSMIGDSAKLNQLVNDASHKIENLDLAKPNLKEGLNKIRLFIKMLLAYINGSYRSVPWRSIVLITASLIYFITPIDVVPDFIPGVGFIDDVSVILWVFKSVYTDIEEFRKFDEAKQSSELE